MRSATLLLLLHLTGGCLPVPEAPEPPVAPGSPAAAARAAKKATMKNDVLTWLRLPPLADTMTPRPRLVRKEWLAQGRKLPHVEDVLLELLEEEDLAHPGGDGERIDYALRALEYKGQRGVAAYMRALGSKDVTLREAAAGSLGLMGDRSVVPALEKVMMDETEAYENVRGNACLSLGRLHSRGSLPLIRQMAHGGNATLRWYAGLALEEMSEAKEP